MGERCMTTGLPDELASQQTEMTRQAILDIGRTRPIDHTKLSAACDRHILAKIENLTADLIDDDVCEIIRRAVFQAREAVVRRGE